MTTSGLPSLLLPCPKCLGRMRYKTTDRSTPTASAASEDTFGCTGCDVEVTRAHPRYQTAA